MASVNSVTWHTLTKHGLPQFVVNRVMTWGDQQLEAGDIFPGADIYKTRNLFQLNYIAVAPVKDPEPVEALVIPKAKKR